jgi:hypothetical protein
MNLGLENKPKTARAILVGLALVCGFMLYQNFLAGPSAPPAAGRPAAVAAGGYVTPTIPAPSAQAAPRAPASRGRNEEFHPALHPKRQEDRPDWNKIDPRLHLELLAKLQKVADEGNGRNLFQFGPPPPPKDTAAKLPKEVEPVVTLKAPVAPPLAGAAAPAPPPPFKYYGFVTERATGRKTAFFMEGDENYKAAEGELVKKRYRVVRIGVNSVVLEDTQEKRQSTLQLAEDAGGNAG